jgi:hypothetical protein
MATSARTLRAHRFRRVIGSWRATGDAAWDRQTVGAGLGGSRIVLNSPCLKAGQHRMSVEPAMLADRRHVFEPQFALTDEQVSATVKVASGTA